MLFDRLNRQVYFHQLVDSNTLKSSGLRVGLAHIRWHVQGYILLESYYPYLNIVKQPPKASVDIVKTSKGRITLSLYFLSIAPILPKSIYVASII